METVSNDSEDVLPSMLFVPISTVLFLSVYYVLSPAISHKLVPKYRTLEGAKLEDWNNNMTSTVHAIVVSLPSLYLFIFDEATHKDKLWAKSSSINLMCAVVAGYMIADLIIMKARTHKLKEETFYFFHHFASAFAYLYGMNYNVCAWFRNVRALAELSTPFLNLKYYLDVLDHKKTSKIYIYSGILLTLIFFLCRILVMPYYYYTIYSLIGTEDFERLGYAKDVLRFASVILDSCNLFWFYKLLRGGYKIITAKMTSNDKQLEKVD